MLTEFRDVQSPDRNFRGQKKWTNLNQYISVSTDIDEERFVGFEYTIDHLSSGYVYLHQLEYYFFLFFFLFQDYLLFNH